MTEPISAFRWVEPAERVCQPLFACLLFFGHCGMLNIVDHLCNLQVVWHCQAAGAVSDSCPAGATPLHREAVTAFRFIQPCSPIHAKEVPASGGWLHEVKFDGYRVQMATEAPLQPFAVAIPRRSIRIIGFTTIAYSSRRTCSLMSSRARCVAWSGFLRVGLRFAGLRYSLRYYWVPRRFTPFDRAA